MKKRTAVLVLAMGLALSFAGCGNSGEPKQEESQITQDEEQAVTQETEQETEVNQEEVQIQNENGPIETDMFKILREGSPDSGEIVSISDDIAWEICNVEHTMTGDTWIYTDEGEKIGLLKENVTITFTEEDSNGTWYRFKNPESQIDSEYLLVDKKTIEYQQGEEERQTQHAEEDRIYNEVMALFDEDKTYTIEEFYNMMQDAAEISGVEFSNDVAQNNTPAVWTINLADGNKLKETYESLVAYMIWGPDGIHKMDMYFGLTEQNPDTSGDFEIYVFLRYHQE